MRDNVVGGRYHERTRWNAGSEVAGLGSLGSESMKPESIDEGHEVEIVRLVVGAARSALLLTTRDNDTTRTLMKLHLDMIAGSDTVCMAAPTSSGSQERCTAVRSARTPLGAHPGRLCEGFYPIHSASRVGKVIRSIIMSVPTQALVRGCESGVFLSSRFESN